MYDCVCCFIGQSRGQPVLVGHSGRHKRNPFIQNVFYFLHTQSHNSFISTTKMGNSLNGANNIKVLSMVDPSLCIQVENASKAPGARVVIGRYVSEYNY